eukprot:m.27278 g.27278  ORF g.27278 m.27278 type:complete len:128 (+) comp11637_c0_seq3:28-411(+)
MLLRVLLVGLIWGCSNPLLKIGSRALPERSAAQEQPQLKRIAWDLYHMATTWQFVLPFLLNQSGSVAFFVLLGQVDLSVAVPAVNALCLATTAVVGSLLGEEPLALRGLLGALLVLLGVLLCALAKQ